MKRREFFKFMTFAAIAPLFGLFGKQEQDPFTIEEIKEVRQRMFKPLNYKEIACKIEIRHCDRDAIIDFLTY